MRACGTPAQAIGVDGVDLFVRRLGDPGLPTFVVVHGGPTWDHSYLEPAVGRLADVAHVVLFDLPGCGRSHRTPPVGDLDEGRLQPERLADTVAGLIRSLGPRADVLGFSFGGRIAMRVVDQHPDVVDRLVLASTTAYTDFHGELHESPGFRERSALCTDVGFDGPDPEGGALSRAMAHGSAPLQIWRLDRSASWRRVLDRVRFSSDYNPLAAARALHPAAPDDAAGVLQRWAGPVLILHGAHDLVFPPGVARRLHAALPHSTLAEIPEAGHMAHFDDEARWLAAIRDFLRSTSPGPRPV